MLFSDALTLDAPRRTSDGYMAVRARSARTGVYRYTGREVDPENKHGLRDQAIVNVLRDDATVFDEAAARSFIGKPVTDNHPSVAVNASNWRDHARGTIMGAMRDGDYLAFDILLTDAETISKVDGGKRELSNGYGASLEYGSFTAKDGTVCQARQAQITGGNHVALVQFGRAGSECAIKDGFAVCDAIPSNLLDSLTKTEKPVKTMLIDGLTVDVSNADTAEATIKTLIAARDAAGAKVAGLETQVATLTTDKATLEGKVKELTDAKPTPAQLRDAAKAYSAVVEKAKAHGVAVTDAMDEQAIVKATVLKHLGDAAESAKEWTDAQFASSFAMLKDAKPAAPGVQPLGAPVVIGDAAAKEAAALADANDHNAWRSKSAA